MPSLGDWHLVSSRIALTFSSCMNSTDEDFGVNRFQLTSPFGLPSRLKFSWGSELLARLALERNGDILPGKTLGGSSCCV